MYVYIFVRYDSLRFLFGGKSHAFSWKLLYYSLDGDSDLRGINCLSLPSVALELVYVVSKGCGSCPPNFTIKSKMNEKRGLKKCLCWIGDFLLDMHFVLVSA